MPSTFKQLTLTAFQKLTATARLAYVDAVIEELKSRRLHNMFASEEHPPPLDPYFLAPVSGRRK